MLTFYFVAIFLKPQYAVPFCFQATIDGVCRVFATESLYQENR
jgi:hypothetical protein